MQTPDRIETPYWRTIRKLATTSGFQTRDRTYADEAAFSNCFNLFASNSRSRRFFVIAIARWISSLASESLPNFISRSPRTLGKRWYPASADSLATSLENPESTPDPKENLPAPAPGSCHQETIDRSKSSVK